MHNSKTRKQIAWEAARLMYERQESEYLSAKWKAAKRICRGWVKPADLPSNAEIREEIQCFARLHEGDSRKDALRAMRIEAYRLMQILSRFRPRIIGSVYTGHIRQGSDIDLHVFSDSIESICHVFDELGVTYDVERKQIRKQGESRTFTHLHLKGEFPVELTVYASDLAHFVFKSSITGKPIERASIAEFEQFMQKEYPDLNLAKAMEEAQMEPDRYQLFESLLLPLEDVKQSPKYHPEGDVLYHSLHVFEHARDRNPYDEEFLLAALLHDVGKGIENQNHVEAGLEALEGFISERTAWLIEHHMIAHKIHDGSIGARAHRRLRENESYEDLLELNQCDKAGRQRGVEVPDLEEVLDYLRNISSMF